MQEPLDCGCYIGPDLLGMTTYQGSDWFKSGVHLRNAGEQDTQKLVRHADREIADCARKLQAAYDGALIVFSNFTGTDAEVLLDSVSRHRHISVCFPV